VRLGNREPGRAPELTFAADGRLWSGSTMLANVTTGKPGTFARVMVGEAEYDLVRRARSGWHCAIVRSSDENAVCDFLPFRIKSGGRLRWGNVEIQLRRRPLASWQWYFMKMDGRCVLADAKAEREDTRLRGRSIKIRQRGEQAFDMRSSALVVLVFGCWLVVQWEAVPMRASNVPPVFLGN
jgi:hypothetical protein